MADEFTNAPSLLEPQDTGKASSLMLMHLAWRHKGLLMLGPMLGILLGMLYYVTVPPVYSSSAQVLVVQKRADEVVGTQLRQQGFQDHVSTHQVLVTSPVIISKAIAKRNLGSLAMFANWEEKWAAGGLDLVGLIKKAVNVIRQRGATGSNNVLELTASGVVAEDCKDLLDALLESYIEFLAETYKDMSEDALSLINKAREKLDKDIQEKDEEYKKFREDSPLLSAKGKEGVDVRQESLGKIQDKRAMVALRRAELEGQLVSVLKAQKEKLSREALLTMLIGFNGKMEMDEPRRESGSNPHDQLHAMMDEEKRLLADFGPGYSKARRCAPGSRRPRRCWRGPARRT